jgi:hypothetical protein
MKRLHSLNLHSLSLAATIVAMTLASTAALAQPYPHPPGPPPGPGYDHPPGHPPGPPGPPGGPGWHQWHQGEHYHGDRYAVHNWQHYHLRPPPPGYEWVQDGGQFVMIAVATGIIADIIVNSQYQ